MPTQDEQLKEQALGLVNIVNKSPALRNNILNNLLAMNPGNNPLLHSLQTIQHQITASLQNPASKVGQAFVETSNLVMDNLMVQTLLQSNQNGSPLVSNLLKHHPHADKGAIDESGLTPEQIQGMVDGVEPQDVPVVPHNSHVAALTLAAHEVKMVESLGGSTTFPSMVMPGPSKTIETLNTIAKDANELLSGDGLKATTSLASRMMKDSLKPSPHGSS